MVLIYCKYLCWNHKLVCAASCFCNVFFVFTFVLGLTVILASVVSSPTDEKDCVRWFFNSLLWVWSCHAAWALPHSITKVKQPVYFGASPSNCEMNCVSMRMKEQRNAYTGDSLLLWDWCFWGRYFSEGWGLGLHIKSSIRFEACLDKRAWSVVILHHNYSYWIFDIPQEDLDFKFGCKTLLWPELWLNAQNIEMLMWVEIWLVTFP